MDAQSALEAPINMGGRSAETSLPSVFSFADLRATDLVMEDQLAQANASAAGQQSNSAAAIWGWPEVAASQGVHECLEVVLSESLPE